MNPMSENKKNKKQKKQRAVPVTALAVYSEAPHYIVKTGVNNLVSVCVYVCVCVCVRACVCVCE